MAIWSQAFLLDEGRSLGANYYFFEQAFGVKKRNWFSPMKTTMRNEKTGKDEVVSFSWEFDKTKTAILHDKISRLAITYTRGEVAPSDIVPNVVKLKMLKLQQDAYDDMVAQVIKEHHEHGSPQAQLNNFIRLRQIASGFLPYVNDDKITNVEFPGSIKLAWLIELLSDLNAKCVVFHEFLYSGGMICRALKSAKIKHGWIHGDVKDKSKIISDFKSGKIQVIVATTATGGMSINLSEADYLIFYESPTSPIIRQQAEARPMADRGNRPILIEDLVCSSIEYRILSFIREGKHALRELRRDPTKLRLE